MQIDILTPTDCLYSGIVQSAKIPLQDGLIGILPGHAPLTALLGQGILDLLNEENKQCRFIIDGGVVKIASGKVNILADYGDPVQKLDENKVRQEYEAVQKAKAFGDEIKQRIRRLAIARIRLQTLK